MRKILCGLMALAFLSACTTDQAGNKQTIGTLLGAGGGAVLGSNVGKGKGNIAAIAVGTLLGAYTGSEIGASLDRADMMYANQTAQNAFETAPSGRAMTWQNPDSGNSGTVTPIKTFQTNNGQYCREYTQTVQVGGQSQEAYGTACRQPDGAWLVVK